MIVSRIPLEETQQSQLDEIMEKAIQEAKACGIYGKGVTPFLLAKVEQFTRERNVWANLAFLMQNAKVAAELAVERKKVER